jgi:hypothetical protein
MLSTLQYTPDHKVYRVPGFLSSRPNGSPHPLSTYRECCSPPPLGPRGRYTRLRERGWVGDPVPPMGQTFWYSRYTNYNPADKIRTRPKSTIKMAESYRVHVHTGQSNYRFLPGLCASTTDSFAPSSRMK